MSFSVLDANWAPRPVVDIESKLAEFGTSIEQFNPETCDTSPKNMISFGVVRASLAEFKEVYSKGASLSIQGRLAVLEDRALGYLEQHQAREPWMTITALPPAPAGSFEEEVAKSILARGAVQKLSMEDLKVVVISK